jgi:hypothetical protein
VIEAEAETDAEMLFLEGVKIFEDREEEQHERTTMRILTPLRAPTALRK